jgi:hypothetical protein
MKLFRKVKNEKLLNCIQNSENEKPKKVSENLIMKNEKELWGWVAG